MKIMGGEAEGGTSFMEDYTYHMEAGNENGPLVPTCLRSVRPLPMPKPSIVVRPLGIGGKADPARFIFSARKGEALCASLVDLGGRMRLIINEVEAVETARMRCRNFR